MAFPPNYTSFRLPLISAGSFREAMSQTVAAKDILWGYRSLYRHGLRAVHYSKPARYVLRDVLRKAFRTGKAEEYDRQKVRNTLEFLNLAAREQAMEHKVLKNILHVRFWSLRIPRERRMSVSLSSSQSALSSH
jgi:hypothetical protein